MSEYDYLFKILIIGNNTVGKSQLLFRFVEDGCDNDFVPTIGVDFVRYYYYFIYNLQKLKTLNVEGKKVKLQIWDTAGEERFKNITASYYRGGNGIILVYDITDRDSFESLNSWLIEIEKNKSKDICKILVGNNCDKENERKVSYQEGKDFAEANNMKFCEASPKTSYNVKTIFETLTIDIITNNLKNNNNKPKKESEKITCINPLSKLQNCIII